MLDIENIWKDRFNDDKLNSEEWLEPNPDIISNVMANVQTKRKRRSPWIFFLLGF